MATLEEIDKQLLILCPSLARKIRQCGSDEEASELLYSTLSEVIGTTIDGLRASLKNIRFSGRQE